MVLVAATAIGFGLVEGLSALSDGDLSWRAVYEAFLDLPRPSGSALWREIVELCWTIIALSVPHATMWTLALIPIRFMGPRPPWLRLARQPGLIAAVASGVTMVFIGAQFLVIGLVVDIRYLSSAIASQVVLWPILIGLAVAVSWMTLLIGGRWRAEPSWIDRLGRVMGVGWIVAGLAVAVVHSLVLGILFG
jgi:hypothetical protein